MILDQVDAINITLHPLKCNTPRAVYVYAVTLGFPLQPVEIKAGNVYIQQVFCFMKNHQSASTPVYQIRSNTAGIIFPEEPREPFVPEASDHV